MRNLFGLLVLLRLVQDTALANSKQDKLFYIYDWPNVLKRQKTLRADEGNRHRMLCFWLYSLIYFFFFSFLALWSRDWQAASQCKFRTL